MSFSPFNKKLQKSCSFCVYGKKSDFGNEVFCTRNGVTDKRDYCRRYKYDPLKRSPEIIKPSDNYTADDFKL